MVNIVNALELKMATKGYASCRLVAKKTSRHYATILRMCNRAETCPYECLKIGSHFYLTMASVNAEMTPAAAKLLDMHDWSAIFGLPAGSILVPLPEAPPAACLAPAPAVCLTDAPTAQPAA